MSELELTPEQTDPEATELTDRPTEPKSKGGRPKGSAKPRIDYDQRIEDLISAMNDLIEKGELTATVERAYNRQIEYFQFQIQRRDDAKKERDRRELESKVSDNPSPVAVPPAPSVPTVDLETERRVNKMLKQLEELGETPPSVPEAEELKNAEAERDRKTKETADKKAKAAADRKAADELAKKETADKKAARIAELKESQAAILKTMSDRTLLRACVDNPALGRGMSERLDLINRELRSLEPQPQKVSDPLTASFASLVEEQKVENARTQREYARDWEWQMNGCQTTRPTNFGQFRDED